MKVSFAILVSVLFLLITCSKDKVGNLNTKPIVNSDEESKIFSTIINNLNYFYPDKEIAVKDSTILANVFISDIEFSDLEETISGIEKETFDSFIQSNECKRKLDFKFNVKNKVIKISGSDYDKIFNKGNGWEEFHDTFKNTQGIISFSNVGFNKNKTQALVYYGNRRNGLSGLGLLVLYQKKNNTWKSEGAKFLWQS